MCCHGRAGQVLEGSTSARVADPPAVATEHDAECEQCDVVPFARYASEKRARPAAMPPSPGRDRPAFPESGC